MILCHAHKFIFIKTIKTASSSMEIALSDLLGPDDVITPARSDLDGLRSKGVGGQNYRLQHPDVPRHPLWKRMLGRPQRYHHPSVGFYEHMPAWRVKRYVAPEIWSSYFKFAFERNPWDRQVSYYFYKTRREKDRRSFEQFLSRKSKAYVENYDLYTVDGQMALDFVGRYERIEADFEEAMRRIGLAGRIRLPEANVGRKPKSLTSYRDLYTDRTRDLIGDWYAREIAAFGYTF